MQEQLIPWRKRGPRSELRSQVRTIGGSVQFEARFFAASAPERLCRFVLRRCISEVLRLLTGRNIAQAVGERDCVTEERRKNSENRRRPSGLSGNIIGSDLDSLMSVAA
jgi:hypothetical protein